MGVCSDNLSLLFPLTPSSHKPDVELDCTTNVWDDLRRCAHGPPCWTPYLTTARQTGGASVCLFSLLNCAMDPTIPHSGNTDGTNVASSTHAEASLHVQIAKPSTIGEPCTFAQGQFNGQTIRVVISEIQKVCRSQHSTEVSKHGWCAG